MKKIITLLLLGAILLTAGCTPAATPTPEATATPTVEPTPTPAPETFTLVKPIGNAECELHTESQIRFLSLQAGVSSAMTSCVFPWSELCKPYPAEHSYPKAVGFQWSYKGERDGVTFTLTVARDAEFTKIERTVEGLTVSVAELYNFYLGTQYYWKVDAIKDGEVIYTSAVESFITSDAAPRNLRVPTISNVRDMGGWYTLDGRRVRQGCMYRSTEFNDHYNMSEEGARVLIEELGIKVDFDIRGMDKPYFDTELVRYETFAMGSYASIFSTLPRTTVRRIYDLMYNSPEEPFIMHCWGGADRTGSLAFLMNGLLGVGFNDLCADFEFTGFSLHGERCQFGSEFNDMLKQLRRYGDDGDSINECIEKFFLKRGLTQADIDALRDKLLVEAE